MSEQEDDRADYEIDQRPSRRRPDPRPPSMLQPVTYSPDGADDADDADDEPDYTGPYRAAPDGEAGDDEPDDAELLADLPPMPPKPEGPRPSEEDLRQADASAARDDDLDGELPDLEALYDMAKGIMPEHDQMIETMAAIHGRWRRAWQDTGQFSDEEAFELVRILVASSAGAIRALD